MTQEKTWKYANHGKKDTLGIIRDATEEKKPITIKSGFALIEEYNSKIKVFKSADRNYPKFMYETLTRLLEIGKQLNSDFTIQQLCKDLNITYERYKFYMKYEQIDEEMKQYIDNKELSQNLVLNIIHRFPQKDWKEVIQKELTYQLTKNDITELRTDNKYKKKKNWEKMHDERKGKRYKQGSSSNKRYIFVACDNFIKELKLLKCYNKPTKKKVYKKIAQMNDKLSQWLKNHKDWSG